VEKPEGKRPLGRSRHNLVANIKMYLGEKACGSIGWIGLAQVRGNLKRLMTVVRNLRAP
jgi:hypothetical protein